MCTQINDLIKAIETNNEQEIIDNLTRFQRAQVSDIELENNFIPKGIISLNNDNITKIFVDVAAEWCKNKQNRQIFTNKEIVDYLLTLLDRPEESLIVSTIRVLGNICYENEDGRTLIDGKALEKIISILQADSNRSNNLLTMKVAGFLVNLLISNDDLQKSALKLNILSVVETIFEKYIKAFNENQMLFAFLLTIVNNVIDYVDDQNVPFTENLCSILIDILRMSSTPEISVLCLEILHGQSDKDEVKTLLAQKGVCELVFDLIEKYRNEVNDEDSRSVMKMACDIIVIILTGEDCMVLLYNEGKGKVYQNMVSWLDSDDLDLLSTGVLAIGNFARKDVHCIQMVKDGISHKLIKLLAKYNKTSTSDIKVQHALLSTLKNLVIPQQNKSKILEEGLIDVIYPMIQIEQYLVIFKLLGTFRMVIDGQEKAALDLISRQEFLEKLVYWCYNSDHLGVRGEIPRLLSWLIKHCHSFKPFRNLIRVKDSVKCIVEMSSSNHAVMQNESFYALNLLCIGCTHSSNDNENTNGINNGDKENNDCFFEQLISADIGKNLNFVVNKYSDKMDKHTIENLLTLLEQLVNSELIVEHLKSNTVNEALAKLSTNPSASSANERLNRVIQQINKN